MSFIMDLPVFWCFWNFRIIFMDIFFFAAYFWRWPCRFKLSRSWAFWWTLFIRRRRQRSWATKSWKNIFFQPSNHPFFSICKKTCEFQGGYISEEKIAGLHVSWILDMFHGCIGKPRCLEKTVYAPSSHIFQPLQGGGFNDFLMFTPISVLMIQFEFRIFSKMGWNSTTKPVLLQKRISRISSHDNLHTCCQDRRKVDHLVPRLELFYKWLWVVGWWGFSAGMCGMNGLQSDFWSLTVGFGS